jgi:hypothetical protein
MAVTSDFHLVETVEHASLQDAGLLEAVQPHTAPIRTVLDEFDAQTQTIVSDPGRNALGRQTDYDKLRETTVAKLATPGVVAELEQQLADLDTQASRALAASLPEPDPLALDVLARQIGGLDSTQLGALYATADPLGRRALEVLSEKVGAVVRITSDGLPTWTPLLDPAVVASFREARLSETAPDLLTQMRRTRRTLNSVKSAYATARALVDRAALR